jgi:carbon monoxide dehydrogenase subunit G
MDFTDTHHFDAPVDAVWAMFRDPKSHVAKFEQMGHREIEVLESDSDDQQLHVKVRRVVTVDLPGFAKRVLKPNNTVTTVDDWTRAADGTCTGEQVIDTEGAPVKISAATRLEPDADGTRYTIEVHLDVKVPLIGGKLADWAKGNVQKQLDDEFAAGDTWLASH